MQLQYSQDSSDASVAFKRNNKIGSFFSVFLSFLASLIYIVSADRSLAADFGYFVYQESDDKSASIRMSGEIFAGDERKFYDIVKKANDMGYTIVTAYLASNGGNVGSAIEISAEIRRLVITTIAEEDGCFSACAIIWLGGVNRYGAESVGLHRSYFSRDGSVTFSEMEASLDASHTNVAEFLRGLRVPDSTVEIFLETSSQEVTIIGDDSLEYDRVFEEYGLMKCGPEPSVKDCSGDYIKTDTARAAKFRRFCEEMWPDKLLSKSFSPTLTNWRTCLGDAHYEAAKEVQLFN